MQKHIDNLISRYPQLVNQRHGIERVINSIVGCYKNGNKIMLCGNGGSAADCTHIVGELVKGFMKKRTVCGDLADILKKNSPNIDDVFLSKLQCGLPAINLCESSALITAYCNDVDPDFIFAQQIFALGTKGDILIAISTSGNAKNVNNAAILAKGIGVTVIGMTGENGGKLNGNSDICIKAPANETYQVQELHLPIYHTICAAVEDAFFEI